VRGGLGCCECGQGGQVIAVHEVQGPYLLLGNPNRPDRLDLSCRV
jgi:hypothetical protein